MSRKNTIIAAPANAEWDLGEGESGLVSYIMPAYNVEAYLPETLESCLRQTYRPMELVLVDDGSSDGTSDVIESFRDAHSRADFRVVFHRQANQGVSVARNEALRLSKGEFIGFVDCDDVLPPRRTELLCAMFADPEVGVACGRLRFWRGGEHEPEPARPVAGGDPRFVDSVPVVSYIPDPQTFLMRRYLAQQTGPFDPQLNSHGEDMEYLVRLRCLGPRILLTDEVVYRYRIGHCSATSDRGATAAKREFLSRKLMLEHVRRNPIPDAESLRRLHFRFRDAGKEFAALAMAAEAREAYILAGTLGNGYQRLFCRSAAALAGYRAGRKLLSARAPAALSKLARRSAVSIAENPIVDSTRALLRRAGVCTGKKYGV